MKGLLAIAVLLTGCAEMPREEYAYQMAHGIDTLQTIQIARSDGCYWEDNPTTSALIGKNPNTAGVIAWGVGMAVGHYAVTRWMSDIGAPSWLRWAWQIVTVSVATNAVKQNHDQGIGLVDNNSCG